MTEHELLNMALQMAIGAHSTQRDKQGQPYILHVLRVVMTCETPETRVVAALHDVYEDTGINPDTLWHLDFPMPIVEAVRLITRPKAQEPYMDYIVRLAPNPIARAVKLADLADNLARVHELPDPDRTRLEGRYHEARTYLRREAWYTDRMQKG